MFVEQEQFSGEDFSESFQKRFISFCDKAPLLLKFTMLDDGILLYNLSEEIENIKPKSFDFDYSLDDKNNIKKIKDWMVENWYPVFEVNSVTRRDLTALEIQALMVDKKLSFEEASEKTVCKEEQVLFRLEKVLHSSNSIIVRNMETKRASLYRARKPIIQFTSFLKDKERTQEFFERECEFQKNIFDSAE